MTLSHEFVRLHKSLTYDALSGAAIEAAKAGQTDDDGTDDEEPPQFGAADPV